MWHRVAMAPSAIASGLVCGGPQLCPLSEISSHLMPKAFALKLLFLHHKGTQARFKATENIYIPWFFFHGFTRSATPVLPVLFHLTPGPRCSLQQLPSHTPKVLELQRGTVLLLKLTPAACVAKKN